MKKTTLIGIGAMVLAAIGFGAVMMMSDKIGENLVYYWSPKELVENGEKAYGPTIRLGGLVKPGSLVWDKDKTHLSFEVVEDRTFAGHAIKVVSAELPPQMFREGIGVVVEGTYDRSGTFTSNRLMVNHSNEYQAPHEVDDKPVDWKNSINAGDPQASKVQQ